MSHLIKAESKGLFETKVPDRDAIPATTFNAVPAGAKILREISDDMGMGNGFAVTAASFPDYGHPSNSVENVMRSRRGHGY